MIQDGLKAARGPDDRDRAPAVDDQGADQILVLEHGEIVEAGAWNCSSGGRRQLTTNVPLRKDLHQSRRGFHA
jgi:hypothetical protein